MENVSKELDKARIELDDALAEQRTCPDALADMRVSLAQDRYNRARKIREKAFTLVH